VSLGDALQVIESQFDPRDTVVLTVTGQDPYRFMMYYLPAYRVLRLDPQTHSVLAARAAQQGTWTVKNAADCLFGQGSVRHAVWVLSAMSEPGIVPPESTLVSNVHDGPFQVWEVEPGPATPDYLGFNVGGNCDVKK
jgi:hypothetical protein